MTRPMSVVVIGAGAAGLSAAMAASRLGATVTVLEKDQYGQASSGLSAGIFNRQTVGADDLALRLYSARAIGEFEREAGLTVARSGYVRLVRTEAQLELAREAAARAGTEHVELISPQRLAEIAPGIRTDDVLCGMYGPTDGHIDGPELCATYLRLGKQTGVRYVPGAELVGVRRSPARIELLSTAGEFTADVVINASGGWLGAVAQLFGHSVGMRNQRHQTVMVRVDSLADRDFPIVQSYFPGAEENAAYVRPERRGEFVAGLHSYAAHGPAADPESYSRTVELDYIEQVATALVERFPQWEDASFTSGWAGIYPISADGGFVIGPHAGDPRVVELGALSGVGLSFSPAVGQLAAEWAVLGESRTFDFADSFLPDRPSLKVTSC
ncbi:FAD-binding oxidoreductase [Mycobacterium sp. ACS4331]|uniref:NAD(P)/FAD-dependent oxidoreductase n=1 Tax=Mycobacterium sp. ACS4331 TaxID=1834121 RepID=UPI0009EEA722|nr:FAD-binding oxidoreductase [Mycobacterium sp. ACS4331]